MSLYKQVQGEITHSLGGPGQTAMLEVSWRVPTRLEGNNRTEGQGGHRRASARQGVLWILKPEGVPVSSLDPARHRHTQLIPPIPDFCRVSTSPPDRAGLVVPGHLTCPFRFKEHPRAIHSRRTPSAPITEREELEANPGLLSFHSCKPATRKSPQLPGTNLETSFPFPYPHFKNIHKSSAI